VHERTQCTDDDLLVMWVGCALPLEDDIEVVAELERLCIAEVRARDVRRQQVIQ
jgi:hypothetical protein